MPKKKIQYLSLLLFLTYLLNICVPCILVRAEAMSTPVSSFSDITGHWAEKGIKAWTAHGLAGGYPDGTFRPDSSITRAEFLTLLNRAFGYTEMTVGQAIDPVPYCDVTEIDWYAGEIAKAAGVGYLGGYPDSTIRPQNSITRQEVAVFFARILPVAIESSEVDNLYLNNDNVLKDFTDEVQIPEWSREAIAMAVSGGYMNGYPDGNFRSAKAITRAEAITVLERAAGTIYNCAGTYGPFRGNLVLEGNVTITTPSVTLQNTTITGNLYLTEGIGEGEVTLDNVTVQGTTKIGGGGSDSIHLINTTIGSVLVNVPNRNLVRLLAQGSTAVGTLEARTPARLEEMGLTGTGFTRVRINNQQETPIIVELLGELSEVEIHSPAVQVNVQKGSINSLTLASTAQAPQSAQAAQSVQINLAAQTAVANLIADTPVVAQGQGTIETTLANVDGVVIETPAKNVFLVDGVQATVEGKTITESIIGAKIKKKKSRDATLSDLILDGATGRATIPGFDPDKLFYNVVLPCGSDENNLPLVEATARHAKAKVEITQAEGFTFANNTAIATILVTAESGRTQTYTVCFSVALDTAKAITDFRLFVGTESGELESEPLAVGKINEDAKTISVTVPHGTDVESLTPVITYTGESISPASGVEQDFSDSVIYTVTAADGLTAEYTVTVTVAPSAETALAVFTIGTEVVYDVLELDLPGITGDGAILAVSNFSGLKGITVKPANSSVQSVTVTLNDTKIAKDDLANQVIEENDIIVVMVVAEDGNTAQYKVTVVPILVTGVSLNKAVMFLQEGTTAEEPLIATVEPDDATNKNVTWSSSDETIAIVGATGLVAAKSIGTVKITATTVDGGKEAICWVKVVASDSDIPVIDDSCVLYLDGSTGNAPASKTWYDLSGKGNHGTLNNFAYAEGSGWTGQGLEFDGKSDYVDCGRAVVPEGDFTITALCDVRSFLDKGGYRTILGQYLVGDTGRFWFGFDKNTFGYRIGGDSQTVPAQTGVQYLSMIKQGTEVKLYVNGGLKSTSTVANEVLQINAVVGAYDVTNGYFDGIIHNVFVYNRALSPLEITQNYLATKSLEPLCHVGGAVLDLRGTKGTNIPLTTVWQDASGYENHGTLNNFAYAEGSGWTGQGLEFDGENDYVDCERAVVPEGDFTITALCDVKSFATNGYRTILGQYLVGDTGRFWFGFDKNTFGYRIGGDSQTVPAQTGVQYLSMIKQGTEVKLYVNGGLKSTSTVANEVLQINAVVGAYDVTNGYFDGIIHNVFVYNRALSPLEITQNYFATKSLEP